MPDVPICNGLPVLYVREVAWSARDDADLTTADGLESWRVVGRAVVAWSGGGEAHGLVVERDACGGVERACVLWERFREGGGRFRLLPLGSW